MTMMTGTPTRVLVCCDAATNAEVSAACQQCVTTIGSGAWLNGRNAQLQHRFACCLDAGMTQESSIRPKALRHTV